MSPDKKNKINEQVDKDPQDEQTSKEKTEHFDNNVPDKLIGDDLAIQKANPVQDQDDRTANGSMDY